MRSHVYTMHNIQYTLYTLVHAPILTIGVYGILINTIYSTQQYLYALYTYPSRRPERAGPRYHVPPVLLQMPEHLYKCT